MANAGTLSDVLPFRSAQDVTDDGLVDAVHRADVALAHGSAKTADCANVCGGQFLSHLSLERGVDHVQMMATGEQVPRVDAGRIVAGVARLHAVEIEVGQALHQDAGDALASAVEKDDAIALVFPVGPQNTFVGVRRVGDEVFKPCAWHALLIDVLMNVAGASRANVTRITQSARRALSIWMKPACLVFGHDNYFSRGESWRGAGSQN